MRVLFFASGTGSTIKYVASKLINTDLGKNVELVGVVMEDNEKSYTLEIELNKFSTALHYRLRVNRDQFADKIEFYNDIYENIKDLNIDIIVLAGWMQIVTPDFINEMNILNVKIVNLHPSLQYQLIGRDIYDKIWNMYQEGMIKTTGAMVHYVTPVVDRGTVICEKIIKLEDYDTKEEYIEAMYGWDGIEKRCLLDAIVKLATESVNPINKVRNIEPENYMKDLRLVLEHRGKVRDIYGSSQYPNLLFIKTSDRISANDIVIAYLQQKGFYLNQINAFWQKLFNIGQLVNVGNVGLMVVKRLRPIPLEIIIRRRLFGSLWKDYRDKGLREINGYKLTDGMNEGDLFTEPIITPTTKGKKDRPITFKEILEWGIVNKRELDTICEMSLDLFKRGEQYMQHIGVEMIDTKFEVGFDTTNGNISFIDEIFTPDSSRFIVNGVRMDKDILRKWATENYDLIMSHKEEPDGCRNVELPYEVSERLIANYRDFYAKLLMGGSMGMSGTYDVLERNVVIIAGSKSDWEWVGKIKAELAARNIISWVYYSSAHKNTDEVMGILKYWEQLCSYKKVKVVFVTVAGMSNALSGVVASNVHSPVIACPPLTDKDDFQININSTLQMPSGVSCAVILRPDNVAAFCNKIL